MLERYKWLNAATEKIRFGPDRKAVRRELEDHLEDAKERQIAAGLPEEKAEETALAAMGDPNAIAEELGRLHKPWLGYLWRLSQVLLLAAVGLCVVLIVVQANRTVYGLPGANIRDYLAWEFPKATRYYVLRDYPSGASVKTGGRTIKVERAALEPMGYDEPGVNLVLDLHIGANWQGEELYWGPNVIAEVRDSTGLIYAYGSNSHEGSGWASSGVWGLGQKAKFTLYDVPEDAEWVELDIGYGSLMRTLHVDLTEEVGS